MNALAETLLECAHKRNLSTTDLARVLGVSRAGLYCLLSNERVGIKALRGIAREFPELDHHVMDYLRDGHDED